MLYILLKDGATRAKTIKQNFKPVYPSIKAYLDFIKSIFSKGDRITYNDDGTATVKI